jgi:hypothetical protein
MDARGGRKKVAGHPEIIPGDWGKVEPGWLAQTPLSPFCKERRPEAQFTSSSAGVRAPSVTRTGTERPGTIEKPFRAGSSIPGWFRAWGNRSYPEGKWLLLRNSTERVLRTASSKGPQRRRKAGQSGHSDREDQQAQAWSATPSKRPATLQTAPLACERKATSEIRGQTRGTGPTHRQKRWPSRRKTVKTRNRSHKRVFTRFASRRPANASPSEPRGLTR